MKLHALQHGQPTHALQRGVCKQDKLEKVGQDFESLLAQQMLKEAWPQGESSDSGSEMMTSMGIEAMAQSIGQSGALGLSQMVLSQIRNQPHSPAGTASGELTGAVSRTE